jgi:hypothetical protein
VSVTQTDAAGNTSQAVATDYVDRMSVPFVESKLPPTAPERPSVVELPRPDGLPVLEAVNRVFHLGGAARLTAGGIVSDTVNAISRLSSIGRVPPTVGDVAGETRGVGSNWWSGTYDFGSTGGQLASFAHRPGGLSSGLDVDVQTLVRDRTLLVQFADASQHASAAPVEYRVQRADGSPLPPWLSQIGSNLVMGQCPPGMDRVSLRVIGIYKDGSSNVTDIEIDTVSGEIKPLPPGRRSDHALPFSHQFAQRPKLIQHDIDALAALLDG